MKHKISQTLLAYWNEVRGERVAPRRFDIEPSRIAGILADTFILECGETGGHRFRLAGTRVCALLGREPRDRDLAEVFRAEDQGPLQHILSQAAAQAPVTVMTVTPARQSTAGDDAGPRFEMLLTPLFHTQPAVSRFLGSLAALEPAHAHASAQGASLRLVGHETIWPDGRPRVVLEKLNRQSPFAPEHRHARIVTADRRRFRVFDGGRA